MRDPLKVMPPIYFYGNYISYREYNKTIKQVFRLKTLPLHSHHHWLCIFVCDEQEHECYICIKKKKNCSSIRNQLFFMHIVLTTVKLHYQFLVLTSYVWSPQTFNKYWWMLIGAIFFYMGKFNVPPLLSTQSYHLASCYYWQSKRKMSYWLLLLSTYVCLWWANIIK